MRSKIQSGAVQQIRKVETQVYRSLLYGWAPVRVGTQVRDSLLFIDVQKRQMVGKIEGNFLRQGVPFEIR
jgi:hypothetical protein